MPFSLASILAVTLLTLASQIVAFPLAWRRGPL